MFTERFAIVPGGKNLDMDQRPSFFPAVLAGIVTVYLAAVGLVYRDGAGTPAEEAVSDLLLILAGGAAVVTVVLLIWVKDRRDQENAPAPAATRGYETDD